MTRRTAGGPRRRDYLPSTILATARARGALLPKHDVRLAVLYGSLARGDEDAGSDLDLLVSLADDRLSAGFELAVRLEARQRPPGGYRTS